MADVENGTVTVTSAPRFNVRIRDSWASYQDAGTFDFSTGNSSSSQEATATENRTVPPNKMDTDDPNARVEGRLKGFSAVLQIVGKGTSADGKEYGLKGCELPDEDTEITFQVKLSSTHYEGKAAATPLLWSVDGVRTGGEGQADGRELGNLANDSKLSPAPYNNYLSNMGCYNGGEWTAIQREDIATVTVKGFEIDLSHIPYTDGDEHYYEKSLYNTSTNETESYWSVQTACFSSGELWYVQPFKDAEGNELEGGNYRVNISDGNLSIKGVKTQLPDPVSAWNDNQTNTEDDTISCVVRSERKGSIDSSVRYETYNNKGDWAGVGKNYYSSGADWIAAGLPVSIRAYNVQYDADFDYEWAASEQLVKFDSVWFEVEGVTWTSAQPVGSRVLYGAKPNGYGWDHQGKDPDENSYGANGELTTDSYDYDMMSATADDLVFYESLEELEADGKVCVAVLIERRGLGLSDDGGNILIDGQTSSDVEPNTVYMVSDCVVTWDREHLRDDVAAWLNDGTLAEDVSDEQINQYVTAENGFPSRANAGGMSYESDYPDVFRVKDWGSDPNIRRHHKTEYDASGMANPPSGYNFRYGDSCLVVPYATTVDVSLEQKEQSGSAASELDLDMSERVVDYVVTPTVTRSDAAKEQAVSDVVEVTITLPEGLTYERGSAVLGGTYTQNGVGIQGTVEGGTAIPETRPAGGGAYLSVDSTGRVITVYVPVDLAEGEVSSVAGPIHLSCRIGQVGDEAADVKNDQRLEVSATARANKEQQRVFRAEDGNLDTVAIQVSKTKSFGLYKTADSGMVEAGAAMGFTLNVGNNGGDPMNGVVALESLPYDGNGLVLSQERDVDVLVSSLEVTDGADLIENDAFKLYYTTSDAERGKKSSDYSATDITGDTTGTWTELTVGSDGAVKLPEGDFSPVAIAAVGDLPAGDTLRMHVGIELSDGGAPGDRVTNRLTQGSLESTASCTVVSRSIGGTVWEDADADGFNESGESSFSDVTVTLVRLKDGGDAESLEGYETYKNDEGVTASIAPGKQMDLLSGKVTDYADGGYLFTNVPEGTFGVVFSDGEKVDLKDWMTSPSSSGSAQTDSKATPEFDADGLLDSAHILGIEMLAASQIGGGSQSSSANDVGLHSATRDIVVSKVWDDSNNQDGYRPDSVTVNLMKGQSKVGESLTLNASGNWTGEFSDVPRYNKGVEIEYSVTEDALTGDAAGKYTAQVTGDTSQGFTVTNTHTPDTVSIEGKKTWNDGDNADGTRPQSVTIRLKADGKEVTSKTVAESDDWKWSFESQPKFSGGKEIVYSVTEDAVDDYTTTYSPTGYDVTNSYTPDKTSVTVTKSWNDDSDRDGIRPGEVTVRLLKGGQDTGKTIKLTEQGGWTGSFTDLQKNEGGQPISYSVEEVGSYSGYSAGVVSGSVSEGFTITNTHEPDRISVSGEKTWVDDGPDAGTRPESIGIRLYADGVAVDEDGYRSVRADTNGDWSWTYGDLYKCAGGKEISYSVTEDKVENYTPSYSGMNVTNTLQGRLSVSLTWDDDDNRDCIRPESVQVQLKQGDAVVGTVTLSADNNWAGAFEVQGSAVTSGYTVVWPSVDGYAVASSSGGNGFSATYTHDPATVTISGTKVWEGDAAGTTHDAVTFQLTADGADVDGAVATASSDGGWKWSMTGEFPRYRNESGKRVEIDYDVNEAQVAGYDSEVKRSVTPVSSDEPAEAAIEFTVTNKLMETITVKPADITIYMGGADGSDSGVVVDEDGVVVADGTESLPEPGFTVTLPNDLASSLAEDGGDVTDLEFREADGTRTWKFESYDGRSTEVYRLVGAEGQTATRVQFTDGDEVVTSDQFGVGEHVNQTLTMSLYKGSVGDIVVAHEGATYVVDSSLTGTLTVRGTTSGVRFASPSDDVAEPGEPALDVPEGTTYSINGGDVRVTDDSGVALLFDYVIDAGDNERVSALEARVDDVLGEDWDEQFKYLDLVDTENGNAWVSASVAVTVSWPIPDDVDASEVTFKVLHFEGVHRSLGAGEIPGAILNCEVEVIGGDDLTVSDDHVTFQVGPAGFSPFALCWSSRGGGSEPGPGPTSDELRYEANAADATGSTGPTAGATGSAVTVEACGFAREGFEFAGWSTAPDGGGDAYAPGDPYVLTPGDDVLYAQWGPVGGPDDPTDPDEPADPDDPDEPTDPDDPDEPDEPADPDQPAGPDDPTDPDQPADPDVPAEPDGPGQPAGPATEPSGPSQAGGAGGRPEVPDAGDRSDRPAPAALALAGLAAAAAAAALRRRARA